MASNNKITPPTNPDNFFSKSIRFLFYILFFFTPIVMWTKSSEVFEFNKMLFVYAITILISSAWILNSLKTKKFTLVKTPVDIPIFLFLTSQVISTIISINPHTSIWGYYSRFHGGLASTISYIILFYAFISNLGEDKKAQKNVLLSIIGSSLLVAFYGVLEHFGIDKNVWVQDVQNRVFSTLGQPNWLSAYLLAIFPITIFSVTNSKEKNQKLIYGAASLLLLITILYTKSRSGIGATLIILFIIFAIDTYKLIKQKSTSSRYPILVTIATILLTLFLVGTPWTPSPATIAQTNIYGGPYWPAAEKYLNKINLTTQVKPVQVQLLSTVEKENFDRKEKGLRVGGSDSMEIRKVVWSGAIELAKKYPFFGTGVDTFGYTYYWVRPASHNLLSEWDFLYNRAHNEYLNFAATTGFIGIGTYLLMIGSFIFIFFKAIKNDNPLALPMLLGFSSILITNYFGFSVVCVALFFFLFPAFIISSSSLFKHQEYKIDLGFGFPAIVISFLAIYLLNGTYKMWTSDLSYNQGKNGLLYGPEYLADAISSLEKAVKISPKEPLFQSQLSEAQASAAMYVNEQIKVLPASISAEIKNQYLNARDQYAKLALQNSSSAIDINPYQTNFYKTRAKVGLYLATYDPSYYNDVINSLLKVFEKAPTDAKVVYNIGMIYSGMGRTDEAKAAFQKAIDLKPDYNEAMVKLEQLTATPTATPKK